jgi:hypothetical protein
MISELLLVFLSLRFLVQVRSSISDDRAFHVEPDDRLDDTFSSRTTSRQPSKFGKRVPDSQSSTVGRFGAQANIREAVGTVQWNGPVEQPSTEAVPRRA